METKNTKLASGMFIEKLPAYFLLALIIFVCFFLYRVFEPFMMILILSSAVATVTYPIFEKFHLWFKGRASLASILTCLVVIFAIVIPVSFFVVILIGQLGDAYVTIKSQLTKVDFVQLLSWRQGNLLYDLLGSRSEDIAVFVRSNIQTLLNGITDATKYISTIAAEQSLNLFKSLGLTLYNLLLMFFILFFYYRDGKKIVRQIMAISPLPIDQEKLIIKRFMEISKATLIGSLFTALSQGLIAFIGFSIAGVPSAFFWATAVSVFSLVPVVGTGMIWLPIAISFIITGQIFWGIFLFLWGFFLISTIDNVVRVIFIGSSAKLNPLLTFIAVFGGILAFGLVGVVFGPMLLVMFVTLLQVYELEFAPVLALNDLSESEDPGAHLLIKPLKEVKVAKKARKSK